MKTYNTSQRQLIVGFLKDNAEKQFTIEELAAAMGSNGNVQDEGIADNGRPANAQDDRSNEDRQVKIGKSTIYRLINKMVSEGSVRRTVKGNSRQFLYQYADIKECSSHLHMKCRECGKLFHMDDERSKELMKILHDGSNFDLDMKETLLMGTCETCHVGEDK